MAIYIVNDSMCKENMADKCFDILFDKYGSPQTLTTAEDVMEGRSVLYFDIPGFNDNDQVSIRFSTNNDGSINMEDPKLISKGTYTNDHLLNMVLKRK